MEDRNLFQRLGQVSSGEAAQVFRDHLCEFVRTMIWRKLEHFTIALEGEPRA